MSTSANVPGEPERDRDDAVNPEPGEPTGASDAGEATGASGATEAQGAARAEDASGSDPAPGRGEQPPGGQDVTKKVRQEARRSEGAARKSAKDRQTKPSGSGASGGKSSAVPGREGEGLGLFRRIALFVRQVIAETRKVVTPTRNELVTFSVVVIVFILAMMAYVGVLDFGIGRLVLWVFGN